MISRCWVACTWPRLDLRGEKEFLRRTNVLFAFPIDLLFRVWVTGDIMWSGRERKVKAMQPLWKCNLSSSSNLKTHVKRERGAFPIGLLSKARMTAVTHCEVLGRGSLTLSTSTSTLLDLTNNTLHSTQECSSCQIRNLSIRPSCVHNQVSWGT